MFMWKLLELIDSYWHEDDDPIDQFWMRVATVLTMVLCLVEYVVEAVTYPIWKPIVWTVRRCRR